ncbi:LSU ribosomal protein L24P [Desulfuromusa kysingii]|uniref:Large ribosomal subunit protein uL24 n=1 Tax=Desulfuromusa kysingii TaxID=37625 RepID=A0A1H3WBN3_9BACT|nr:50S ribosomal protein L24 [Desulfuromusa kysingii]SDZ84539.1 LSU ribosomal protein L24P [Desulfuromusa kysingii]
MSIEKTHVKKNDMVEIIAGKERGKTGKVLRVLPGKGRVVVESLNVIKRHTRPNQLNPEGGIVEKEAPLSISNVMLICGSCNQATRTGVRMLEDGSKTRYCKKCNESVDK